MTTLACNRRVASFFRALNDAATSRVPHIRARALTTAHREISRVIGQSHSSPSSNSSSSSASSAPHVSFHPRSMDDEKSQSPSLFVQRAPAPPARCTRCGRHEGEDNACVLLPGSAQCERCIVEVSKFNAANPVGIDDAVPTVLDIADTARWMRVKPAAKKMASNAGTAKKTVCVSQPKMVAARKSAPVEPLTRDEEEDEDEDEDEDVVRELARLKPTAARKTPGVQVAPTKASKKRGRPTKKKTMTSGDIRDSYVAIHSAAEQGDLIALDRLRNEYEGRIKELYSNPFKWDTELIMCVARDGKKPVETITWALEHGAHVDVKASKSAVERKYHVDLENEDGVFQSGLEVLKALHEARPETCNEDTLYCACEFGNLDCVKYCVENVKGCDVSKWPGSKTPKMRKNNLTLIAAQNGHLDVLKYLHDEKDCYFLHPWPDEAISLVMNRQPSSPLGWWNVVRYIQSTAEWRAAHPNFSPFSMA